MTSGRPEITVMDFTHVVNGKGVQLKRRVDTALLIFKKEYYDNRSTKD